MKKPKFLMIFCLTLNSLVDLHARVPFKVGRLRNHKIPFPSLFNVVSSPHTSLFDGDTK